MSNADLSNPQKTLPLSGTLCQFKHQGTGGEWIKCHVVGYHLGHLYGYCPENEWCMKNHDGVIHLRLDDTVQFRSIRTPDQVAADERNAAIEEIRAFLAKQPCDDYHAAVALHDAGYIKP